MDKYSDYLGIDISKETFDVVNLSGKHQQFKNDTSGFKALKKAIPKASLCVMEVTGIYHLRLANFLYTKNIALSVVNPLRIKRFAQMHLRRNKTDKADAAIISLYAQTQETKPWIPAPKTIEESKDIYQTMEQYIEIRASLKSKLSGLNTKQASRFIIKNITSQIEQLSKSIIEMEAKLNELVKSYNPEMLSNITSIVGIGQRTAALLMISTQGFGNFENAKQVCSYFGLAPTENTSGTSVRGSRRITKMGNPLVRKKLFMCSLQASKYNKTCAELYQRLLAKGKSKKTALIAVANKLLKIAFAIAKSGLPYDPYYKSYILQKQ